MSWYASHDLVRRFRPLVILHPEEEYFPVAMNEYLEWTRVVNTATGRSFSPLIPSPRLMLQWLPQLNNGSYTLQLREPWVVHQYDPPQLRDIPFYTRSFYRPPYYYVNYAFTYAYNGCVELGCGCDCPGCGNHEADLEGVCLEIHAPSQRLQRVYFNRHAGGCWIPANECEYTAEGRLIVYSARHSHASYASAGNKKRFFGLIQDECGNGRLWNPDSLVSLDTPDLDVQWLADWHGSLGNGHVDNFPLKPWWSEVPLNQWYWQWCG